MIVERKVFFDTIALKGLKTTVDYYFADENIVEFDDGLVFNSKDELMEYLNERKEHVEHIIEKTKTDIFQINNNVER